MHSWKSTMFLEPILCHLWDCLSYCNNSSPLKNRMSIRRYKWYEIWSVYVTPARHSSFTSVKIQPTTLQSQYYFVQYSSDRLYLVSCSLLQTHTLYHLKDCKCDLYIQATPVFYSSMARFSQMKQNNQCHDVNRTFVSWHLLKLFRTACTLYSALIGRFSGTSIELGCDLMHCSLSLGWWLPTLSVIGDSVLVSPERYSVFTCHILGILLLHLSTIMQWSSIEVLKQY